MQPSPRATPSSRRGNRERVLTTLRDAGSLPQIELARATGLSAATVSNLVRELSDEGWVDVSHMVHNGRRARRVRVAAGKGLIVGVDLAHRHLAVAVAGPDYEILAQDATALTGLRALEEDLHRADRMIDALLDRCARTRDEILAVGVAVPAPVDPSTGAVMPDGALPGWRDAHDAATRIAERFGAPTHLENDANLDLVAETVWRATNLTSPTCTSPPESAQGSCPAGASCVARSAWPASSATTPSTRTGHCVAVGAAAASTCTRAPRQCCNCSAITTGPTSNCPTFCVSSGSATLLHCAWSRTPAATSARRSLSSATSSTRAWSSSAAISGQLPKPCSTRSASRFAATPCRGPATR